MNIAQARFETGKELLIAGLSGRYSGETNHQIPALWQKFGPKYLGHVPGQVGGVTYGVCYNFAPGANFDYLAGVEVAAAKGVPAELTQLRVAPARYAVFPHDGHVSKLGATWMAIFDGWLPKSGEKFEGSPSFERYSEGFDPKTGLGGMEIWVALKS